MFRDPPMPGRSRNTKPVTPVTSPAGSGAVPLKSQAPGQARVDNSNVNILLISIFFIALFISATTAYLVTILFYPSNVTHAEDFLLTLLIDQFCMNAIILCSVLIDWIFNHVTEGNMFIIQSFATGSALTWFVPTCPGIE